MILVFDLKCVLIFLAASVSASTIVMDQNPKQVKATITKTLRIDCMLVDSVATTAGTGLVGRSVSSSTSILHLVRMAIFRGSNQLASITMFSPPTVEVAGSDVTVAGNISASAAGEAGYLSVTIQDPGQEATGNYSCSASGLGADGHMAVLDTSTMVMAAAPDLADVVNFMHQLDLKDRQYSKQLADLASSRDTCLQLLEKKVTDLQTQVNTKDTTIQELQRQMAGLQTQVNTKDYSNITALESKITNLQNQLNAKDTSMLELESRLQTQLNAKDTNITALESKTINLQTQLDAKDTSMLKLESKLQTQLNAKDASIKELGSKVANLQTLLMSKTQNNAVCSASCIVGMQKQIQYISDDILNIHLEGGDGKTYGTVIASYSGLTGPVCDDHWDMEDAHVVCRMLGFSGAREYKLGNLYSYNSTGHDYLLDDVDCTGTEANLLDCPSSGTGAQGVGYHSCGSDKVAGVVCYPGSIHLEGGDGQTSGTVIVTYNNLTGPVCGHYYWDMDDAHVACRMLGWSGATEAKTDNFYNYSMPAGHYYVLDYVWCLGTERDLIDCLRGYGFAVGQHSSGCASDGGDAAGVVCSSTRL